MKNRGLIPALLATLIVVSVAGSASAQDDFSGPIRCYFCFGAADNSSCADPVDPRRDRGKALEVIDCEHGVCLKWTHYWNNVLYMHRTCSQRLESFRIMMIDGVCRSERTGNGYLCMCGKYLCNSSFVIRANYKLAALCLFIVTVILKGSNWMTGG